MTIAFAVVLGASAVAVAVLFYGTVKKNRLGINFHRAACPLCHASLPVLRMPKNYRQATWGGWTCQKCGTEIDKWGVALDSMSQIPAGGGRTL